LLVADSRLESERLALAGVAGVAVSLRASEGTVVGDGERATSGADGATGARAGSRMRTSEAAPTGSRRPGVGVPKAREDAGLGRTSASGGVDAAGTFLAVVCALVTRACLSSIHAIAPTTVGLAPAACNSLRAVTVAVRPAGGYLGPVQRLSSHVRTSGEEFQANRRVMEASVELLRSRLEQVRMGGSERSRARHVDRGKLLPRDRLDTLLDADSPFLELSPLAAFDMYGGDAPCSGLITGIGRIRGKLAMVNVNDATVKGGTMYPITVKKSLRAQTIAMENRLPMVYLVDSGGAFLPLQSEIFPDVINGGRGFYNQARMSAAGIPQIAVVMGSCTAGGAYTPAMCDENIIVANQGTIFLGGPPLVKAATGEEVTAEELGGGDVHARISGVVDHIAANDREALSLARDLFESIVRREWDGPERVAPEDPYYDPAELYGIIPSDTRVPYDVREVIARLVDGSRFHEFKQRYGTTIVTGFARLYGYTIGILANNGVLFSDSSLKATHFIELCCQRRIPILFLQNITGFMVGRQYEHGGITKDGAKLVHAVSNAEVPKLTVIVGASHGAGNYAMCGRAYSPRFLFMWPNARISVMGGEQAANTLIQVKAQQLEAAGQSLDPAMAQAMHDEVVATYEREGSPYFSTARIWDDGILDPLETRQALGLALEAALHAPVQATHNGVFRM